MDTQSMKRICSISKLIDRQPYQSIVGSACMISSAFLSRLFSCPLSEIPCTNSNEPIVEKASDDLDLVLRNACRAALKKGLVSDPDDLLVVTAGLPFGTPGAANVVRIIPAAGPSCWNGVCRADE